MSVSTECVKSALIDLENVKGVIERTNLDFSSEFLTRAEQFLNYLGTSGLLPTLTFYYAKTEGEYGKIANIMKGGTEKLDKLDKNKMAYGIYLYLILNKIVALGYISKNEDPLICFKELSELDPFKLNVIFTQIIPYCEELAKLCQGAFKREKG